jgi:hypothetical protein
MGRRISDLDRITRWFETVEPLVRGHDLLEVCAGILKRRIEAAAPVRDRPKSKPARKPRPRPGGLRVDGSEVAAP